LAEYVFPKINAHCITVNGHHLVFSPGTAPPMRVGDAAFDLVQNCSGMTIRESAEWLRERHGETSGHVARQLAEIADLGYFSEPQPDLEDCTNNLPPPANFGICITHKCNMRCRYCFAGGLREADEPEDISYDTACAAIDFIFDVVQPPWANISLGITGEPQLRWDLIRDVADYGRKKSEESGIGVRFHITTNGLHASPEMLDYLQEHPEDMGVTLSWDGPPDVHNRQRLSRDGADTYERVSRTFELLRDSMKTRPSVTATVCVSEPDMAGVFAHLFEEGVRDLTIKQTRSVAPAITITEESLPAFKASFAELAELLLRADDAQMERLFTLAKDDALGRYIYRIAKRESFLYRCPGGRCGYDIDTNGDIYPCASLVGVTDYRMGNVRTGFTKQAEKFFLEDTSLPKMQACQDCWAKYYCGGPCTYVSALTCGRFDVPYGPDCELIKYLIELAGYVVARLAVERPGLLPHVLSLREPVPMGPRPEALCRRAYDPLWGLPSEAWRVADPIVLTGSRDAGGYQRRRRPKNNKAAVHLKWDDEFLYLMTEVYGSSPAPPTTADVEWWFRESIQFAIDPGNDGGESRYPWKLPEGDYEYGVAGVDGKACIYDCQANPLRPSESGKALITREDDVITYKVAIPWQQVSEFAPSVGAECRFSIVVNDSDEGIRGWLQWTNGLAIRKAPARFGLLRLVE